MAKNTNRVASAIAYVAALGLATGAFAAHWEMTANNAVTYATEVFGGDDPASTGLTLQVDDTATTDDTATADEEENDEQTSIDLKLFLPNDASVSVGTGSELEVTLTLNGARFGQAVNWTDIEVRQTGDDGSTFTKVGGSQKDGRRNDSSVTLRVMTSAEITVADDSGTPGRQLFAVDSGIAIRFDIGSIVGYGGTGTVTASASMRVTDGPDTNFPTEVQSAPREAVMFVDEGDGPDGTPDTEDDVAGVKGVSATSNMIANAMAAMSYGAGNGAAAGQIDLDDRTSFDGTTTKIEVASFTHGANPMANDAKTADGKTSFAMNQGMESNVMVTVTGMVRDGDTIWFDQDDNNMMGSRETLTVNGGTATRTFRIDNITTGSSVYFQPNGDDDMTDGSLSASFAVEYDDEDAVTPAAVSGKVDLEYAGIDMYARAYAIPAPDVMETGTTDIGNVRIKCHAEGDSTCTVFLDCDEQDGTRHFEELSQSIAAGATKVETSASIAAILEAGDTGLTGGRWDGRLSCDVFSDEEVSVQVLVRNRDGHPLINNTYID